MPPSLAASSTPPVPDIWDILHQQRIESDLRRIRDAVERQGQPADPPSPHEVPAAAPVLGVVALFLAMPLGGALLGDLGLSGWGYVVGWLVLAGAVFAVVATGVMVLVNRPRRPPGPSGPRP